MPPLVAITRALGPVAFAINAVANTILKLLNVEPKDEVNSVFTGDELSRMVQDAGDHELLDERRTELLQDALELDRRPLSEVMTPTANVVFAPPATTPAQLERPRRRHRLLAVPRPQRRRQRDPLPAHQRRPAPRQTPATNHSRRRPGARSPASPTTLPLDDALTAMRRSRTHLAAAVAADGTTTGVATMADILKQLIGTSQA